MGRRKIIIKQIPDVKLRHITFNKRKNGLFKKAAELSMLCNLNLLLVCEDGLGNLIQYSKNKITDIGSFLSQCNYQTVIDLTAEDYPDFAKINKKKDKDNQESESGMEDDMSPTPQEEERNTRTFQQMAAQHREAPKHQHSRNLPGEANHISEDFSTRSQRLKRGLNMVTSVSEQPPSSSLVNESEINPKKNKNRLNLRLKIPKPETANEPANQQQVQPTLNNNNNDNGIRMPATANIDSMGMPMRKQNDFPQIRPMDKPLDFTSPPFMPYMDLKSLRNMSNMSNMYEPPMTSPFKFYAQNGRIEPSLNSVFKGMSPFGFNIAGTPLVPKMTFNEAEEKLLDTANAIRYINRAGLASDLTGSSHSNPGHKVFTFQPEEASVNQQVQNRNELLMAAAANQRPIPNQIQNQFQSQIQMQTQMQEYVNLPSVPKSEPETDMNIPLDTFSARRFNFDGYFKDFDESAYADPRKKYKMN